MLRSAVIGWLLLVALAVNSPAAVYWVTTVNDGGGGSLRQAMANANGNPGKDTIYFSIGPPGPVYTIRPLSPLPTVSDQSGVYIDGCLAPGASCAGGYPHLFSLKIEIDGINAGAANGLHIQSSNNEIWGLVINNFDRNGVLIESSLFNSARMNFLWYNYIGTDASGTIDKGNGRDTTAYWAGVTVQRTALLAPVSDNYIWGNLISGNWADGVKVLGPACSTHIFDNYIGTAASGMADLGNDFDGVFLFQGTFGNRVHGNLISGNDYDGVAIQGDPYQAIPLVTRSNQVKANVIGLALDWVTPLPNTMCGIGVGRPGWGHADSNLVQENQIAYNGQDGISIWEELSTTNNADHNKLTRNSIYDNGRRGIDLQYDSVTLNDPADADNRANQELNFPGITSITYSAGTAVCTGIVIIDTPPQSATVEVFKARLDPTFCGEGETYLGSTTPNAAGVWTFTRGGLLPGDSLTATTTDQSDNTSEFSFCAPIPYQVLCGDVDYSGGVNVADVTFMVSYLFLGGPLPIPSTCAGDVDGSGPPFADVADLTYLVNYLFGIPPGPAPVPNCCRPTPW